MTKKRSRLLRKMLCIDFNKTTYLLPVEMLQEFYNLSTNSYACAASEACIDATPLTVLFHTMGTISNYVRVIFQKVNSRWSYINEI